MEVVGVWVLRREAAGTVLVVAFAVDTVFVEDLTSTGSWDCIPQPFPKRRKLFAC